MDIIYRAFDGKFFDDETECIAYEKQEKFDEVLTGAKFLDADGMSIDSNDVDEILDQAFYMSFETDKIAQTVAALAEAEGFHYWPQNKGLYAWDTERETFCSLDRKISIAAGEWKRLTRLKRILEGKE